jgi:lipopolysaccharide transport system ATP-binding protein
MSIITVSNLSKAYRIGKKAERADSFVGMLQESIMAPFRNWKRLGQVNGGENMADNAVHWALREISFDIKEGEVLGVIGRNGAGKSTLLKIMSRITEPTSGEVRVRGRVASLLEVGTGFHPELSGRENVYLNGTILGMHKKEIDRKFDEIVDFSGVEKFLDTPIKRYSSGMKVRLAFAVAAHLDPEILIIDEVLAVGDIEFQNKCMGKMRDVSTGGRTVVFVSHNMPAVQALCKTGVLLSESRLRAFGPIEDVLGTYLANVETRLPQEWERQEKPVAQETPWIDKVKVEFWGSQPTLYLKAEVTLRSYPKYESALMVAIDIHGQQGDWVMQAIPDIAPSIVVAEKTTIEVLIELTPLIPGSYLVGVWVGKSLNSTIDWVREIVQFDVSESPTPGRTAPHSRERGFCVPVSTMKVIS